MTPSDDEISAACGTLLTEYDWATMSIDAIRLRLYRAAYSAGMEAAAMMCQQIADWHTQAAMESRRRSEVDIEEDRGIGASECVVAIRAANGREGKQ